MLCDLAKVSGQVKEGGLSLEDDDLRKPQTSELTNAGSDCELELSHQVVKELEKRMQQDLAWLISSYGTLNASVGDDVDLTDRQFSDK